MEWQPTLIFLPGKSHGQRSLEDYSPWDHERAGHDFKTEKQQSLGRDRATAAYAIKQPSKQREMGKNSGFSPHLFPSGEQGSLGNVVSYDTNLGYKIQAMVERDG